MVRVIISVALLVVLCVLVVLNLDHTTPVSLFWVTFDRVSVVAVALVSFVVGVVYSFFLYAARFFVGMRKGAMANRRMDLDRREKEASAQAKEASVAPGEGTAEEGAAASGAGVQSRKKGRRRSR